MKLSIGSEKTLTLSYKEFQALRVLVNLVPDDHMNEVFAEDIGKLWDHHDIVKELEQYKMCCDLKRFLDQAG